MTSAFSENMRVQNALNFQKIIYNQDTRYYFTIGRVNEWANGTPEQANSSILAFNDVWNNMIGAKLITGNDVKLAVPRHNWTANTTYIAYDDKASHIFNPNVQHYVVTSDWNVYKCIANNNGAASNVEPTQTYTDRTIEESDGYVWKYMFTISSEDRLRFTTDDFIPVQTLTSNNSSLQWQVQTNAVEGAIESVRIINSGTGYAVSDAVTFTGNGTGASGVVSRVGANGDIQTISMIEIGQDYTYANVSITSANGTGAVVTPMISPKGGHGSDPIRELGASYVVLNPRIRGTDSNTFPVGNDYRQISLISDPLVKTTGNVASNVSYTQCMTIILNTATSDYEQDEWVYQGTSLSSATFKGMVNTWDAANSTLKLVNVSGTITADILVGETSQTARFVEGYIDQELQPYSGNFLYLNNIDPITRDYDQVEDFKIILKF